LSLPLIGKLSPHPERFVYVSGVLIAAIRWCLERAPDSFRVSSAKTFGLCAPLTGV
jgi:hypothetical protein